MTAPYPVFKLPEFTGFSERQWHQYRRCRIYRPKPLRVSLRAKRVEIALPDHVLGIPSLHRCLDETSESHAMVAYERVPHDVLKLAIIQAELFTDQRYVTPRVGREYFNAVLRQPCAQIGLNCDVPGFS